MLPRPDERSLIARCRRRVPDDVRVLFVDADVGWQESEVSTVERTSAGQAMGSWLAGGSWALGGQQLLF